MKSSSTVLPRPPPLTPSPAAMEEETLSTVAVSTLLSPDLPILSCQKSEIEVTHFDEVQTKPPLHVDDNSAAIQPILPPDSVNGSSAAVTKTELQIMTRKRSSMSVENSSRISGFCKESSTVSDTIAPEILPSTLNLALPSAILTSSESSNNNNSSLQIKAPLLQPPKKKKKYTPKPKKTPENSKDATAKKIACTTVNNLSSKLITPFTTSTMNISDTLQDGKEKAQQVGKQKAPSKPKAAKKPSTKTGSNKKKSRKTKQTLSAEKAFAIEGTQEKKNEGALIRCEKESSTNTAFHRPLVPPLRLQMPKLTKMPETYDNLPVMPILPLKVNVKDERQDWGDNLAETELNEDGSDESGCKISSRKKKSKGRNGNIYIGVFNRIEWMKLQNEFGFGSVNNFGTFVLQTMRRVHGDIQFWCDVAKASGVHTDLDRYDWINGFPHAVNKSGRCFTPEPDVTMTDDKLKEVAVIANKMWDQRLQQLQQQQQELTGDDDVIAFDAVAEDGEEEEDDDALPELDNYLENMTCGQYSSSPAALEGIADNPSSGVAKGKVLTEEQVNTIWNDQMNDSESMEKFGKLFRFINNVATLGT